VKKNYLDSIVKHYEECLEKFGDSHLGVDWPKPEDVNKRYKVMLDIIDFSKQNMSNVSLLDFGCGASHLLEYIKDRGFKNIDYSGLDLSEKFIALSKNKFPSIEYYHVDILNNRADLPMFDFVVMNGVFTEKRELSFDEMWSYFKTMITKVYSIANKGIAFNVMSKNVDWEREDLFHLSTDLLSDFLCNNVTRKFILRSDYGLYEYTAYILK